MVRDATPSGNRNGVDRGRVHSISETEGIVTESIDVDEIVSKAKEKLERLAKMVLLRPMSPDEITQQLVLTAQYVIALQTECQLLKAMIDELKTHHHVTGDMIYGLADQAAPDEPATDTSAGD